MPKMHKCDQPNPFKMGYGAYQSVEERVHATRTFNLDECQQALKLTGLQSTVEKAIVSRIRKLKSEVA